MDIDQMIHQFESADELRAFATSQMRTILEQSKKISSLESEIEHLKELVQNSAPILTQTDEGLIKVVQEMADEEAIAVLELQKLKQISLRQELSMEEAKKYDIYTKTLLNIRGNKTKTEDVTEKLDDDQLLQFAQNLPETLN